MKMSYLMGAVCASVISMCSVTASASVSVVDQSQLTFNTGIPLNGSVMNVGQSFTAGLNGLLSDITVFSNGQLNGSNTVAINLYSGNGTGGSLLGSLSQSVGPNSYNAARNGYAVDINTLGMGVNLVAGNLYTFLFTNVTGAGDLAVRGILASNVNPYAGGRIYVGPGYGDQPTWDLQFQTQVSAVPVPAALWLFGSGLIGLTGLARKHKAA